MDPQDGLPPEELDGDPPEGGEAGSEDDGAPEVSPITKAIEDARQRLAAGEPLTPEGDDAAEEPEGAEASEAEGSDPEGEEEAGESAGEAGEEGVDGEEGEEVPGDEGEGEDEEFVTVSLPGRRPNETREVAVSKELAEDINRLRKGYLRGEQLRHREAKLAERETENDLIDQSIEVDPAGFVLERLHPTTRKEVLLALLAESDLYRDDDVQARLNDWDSDPQQREAERARLKAEREARARQRTVETAATREVARIARHVAGLASGLEDDQGEAFYRASLAIVQVEAKRRGTLKIKEEEVTDLLKKNGLLSAYGISAAAGKGSKGKPASAPRVVTPEEARKTGAQLREQSERRRSAAAVAPAGAGAPSAASASLPKGQTIAERIETVRKRGLAAFTGGS